jgi:hypothetical protein
MADVTARMPRAYRGAQAAAPRGVAGGQAVARSPEDSVVVFLIGMRINRLRRVRSWFPVFVAMPRMLRQLQAQDGHGLLGARSYWSGRHFLVVQYWRSMEDLGRYARDPEMAHQPAWAQHNRRTAATADVGIWHESYLVPAENVESLYGNMPPHGLGAAIGTVPRGQRRRSAAQDRLGQQDPEYVEAS